MALSQYHRDIIRFLRSWGAGHPRYVRNSQTEHPKIFFDWKGKEQFIHVSTTPSDQNSLKVTIREIKSILGNPLTKQPTSKRSLQQMTQDLQLLVTQGEEEIMLNPLDSLSLNPLKELQLNGEDLESSPKKETRMSKGAIALYKNLTSQYPSQHTQLRFFIPEDILEESQFKNKRVMINRSSKYEWEIYLQEFGRVLKSHETCWMTPSLSEGLDFFGKSPADYVLIDNSICVQLHEKDIIPLNEKISKTSTEGRQQINQQKQLTQIDTVFASFTSQIETVLKGIQSIESLSPFRLIKEETTGEWVFTSPVVRLQK